MKRLTNTFTSYMTIQHAVDTLIDGVLAFIAVTLVMHVTRAIFSYRPLIF
jgi:hypothetical protein